MALLNEVMVTSSVLLVRAAAAWEWCRSCPRPGSALRCSEKLLHMPSHISVRIALVPHSDHG